MFLFVLLREMSSFKGQFRVLLLLGSSVLLTIGSGHSYLMRPKGDFKSHKQAYCRIGGPPHAPNDNCPGPCINETSWQYDENTDATLYTRGQVVTMVWARNNHRGGFVRFSLVPTHLRMDKQAHNKLAFRYSCFESGKHVCEFESCGTDVWLYKTDVQIPTSHPDGDYVLSWAWFGGLSVQKSYFGDYFSCTFVRISGGELTSSYTPVFDPGEKTRHNNNCQSSVDRLGTCNMEPCLGYPEMKMQPYPFMEKQGPKPILSSWISTNLYENDGQSAATHTGGESVPDVNSLPNKGPIQSPLPMPSHSLVPSPSPITDFMDTPVRVVGLKMINTDTSEVMAEEFSRTIRVRADMTNFTFVAVTHGDVKSVMFYLNDNLIRTEKVEPYSCWGDTKRNFSPWPNPIFGSWIKLKADVLGKNGKKHNKVFWIRFLIAEEMSPL